LPDVPVHCAEVALVYTPLEFTLIMMAGDVALAPGQVKVTPAPDSLLAFTQAMYSVEVVSAVSPA